MANQPISARFLDGGDYVEVYPTFTLRYTKLSVAPFGGVEMVDPHTLETLVDDDGNVVSGGGIYQPGGLPDAIKDWAA